MFAMVPNRSRWFHGTDALDVLRGEVDAFFGNGGAATPVALPVALSKRGEDVVLEVEVPGVAESDLEVTYHKGKVTLRGERKAPEGVKYTYSTRHFGKFEQSLTLPDDFQGDTIRADFAHGVLSLTLTPRAESKPRRIRFGAVEANGVAADAAN